MSLHEQAVGSMPICGGEGKVKLAEREKRARFTYERARKRLVSRLQVYFLGRSFLPAGQKNAHQNNGPDNRTRRLTCRPTCPIFRSEKLGQQLGRKNRCV